MEEFLGVVRAVRPRLHRFCARMCGSALDGEDMVQETLAQAYTHLDSLRDRQRLEGWLFQIAYRKCLDFHRAARRRREEVLPEDEDLPAPDTKDDPIDAALAPLVAELPPRERAAVIMKDLLEHELSEIAVVVDSTVGAVKSALHRGRARLRTLHAAPPAPVALDAEKERLLAAYVDCFNRQDWDGLRKLVHADARLQVVDAVDGLLGGSRYLTTYAAMPAGWRLAPGFVDGERVIVHLVDEKPHTAIRLVWRDDKVALIRDYAHVDYLLAGASVLARDSTGSPSRP